MSGRNKRLLIVAVYLLACVLVGGTLAYWSAESPAVHVINTGILDGFLEDVYETPGPVYPGAKVDKIVNVKNVGGVDLIARVKITKVWGSKRGTDGKVIPDPGYSTDNILIVFNTTYWWDGGDGYYYYKGILKPGERSLAPLFTEFRLAETTGNEYAGMMADIIVKAEFLQAGGNAIVYWGKSYSQLGVTPPVTPPVGNTDVVFLNPTDKFAFKPTTTDLFANFKNLVPGESRVQKITVGNNYSKTQTIYLRAEAVDIGDVMAGDAVRVREMLRQYAQITVTDQGGTVIYDGPVWGNYTSGSGTDTMRSYISLGAFAPSSSKYLTVTLTLDPSMDNRYQDLWGRIQWRFFTDGETVETREVSGTDSNGSTPFTGDASMTILWITFVAAGIGSIVIMLVPQRKKRETEPQT